jgi:hypothetical protein
MQDFKLGHYHLFYVANNLVNYRHKSLITGFLSTTNFHLVFNRVMR